MIRVAILGGGIGAQHLDGYRALDDFQVTHLVDQDADRLAALCDGDIVGLTEIDDALASDVDVIDICLPPHLHVPITLAALAAGKHVICEKPLATSMAQIAEMRAAAQDAGRHVFPVFQYRFGPAFSALAQLRAAGLLGVPRAAAIETHWNRGVDYYAIPWRGTWPGEQGGAVLGHAIHAHDLLSHVMAPVSGVTARLGTLINPIETEDTAAILFDLEGGGLATSSITLGAATDETRLRLVYEHLTATSDTHPYSPSEGTWRFDARDSAQQAQVDKIVAGCADAPIGFVGGLAEIAKALRGEANQAVTFEDGARSIALVTAIYASHRTGARIELPLPDTHPMTKGWQP
ncbi:Gfo/Idh/MocA family oxidoreductase [uncultured Tateyamaria sp.]|uniref:Gfo/Idh/MocA family protein n=1 Tax=uncultured Tateyamaria sp. TaxID=455651 RepID=UPI00261A1EC9|nr:Gfo/Idh/MocA family oxidoreductase [uncultured Tateyamaria sp.]